MSTTKRVLLWVQVAFYVIAGVNHFVNPGFYLKVMPPYLPLHLELVYLSGVAEIVLGVLLAVPAYRKLAAWGIIALLIAVYPANIYAATAAGGPNDPFPELPVWAAWARLPLQFVLIAWAWWFTREDEPAA